MQEIIWREIHLSIPSEWEMLQFSREKKQGNCAFADREQYRLELNWREVEDEPDYERMVGDYQSRLKDEGMDQFKDFTFNGWHGFDGCQEGLWTSRFGKYFETIGRLVEIVFIWPEQTDRTLIKRILEPVKAVPAANGRQTWQAFGMRIHPDASLNLEDCRVNAAQAQFTFSDKEDATRLEIFERLGLLRHWFNGKTEEWLKGKNPDKINDVSFSRKHISDHDVNLITGSLPPLQFPKIRQKANVYQAAAWICPNDERMYAISRVFPHGQEENSLAGKLLSCCGGLHG